MSCVDDLYANVATRDAPRSTEQAPYVLPTVLLIPPAEDSNDVYCLFRAGSHPRPRSSESSHAYSASIRDSLSSSATVLDQALYIHQQVAENPVVPSLGRKYVWRHGEQLVLSRRSYDSSLRSHDYSPFTTASASATTIPHVRFLVDQEDHLGLHEEEENTLDMSIDSRRSSVFGERPHTFSEGDESSETRRIRRRPSRTRAAISFKLFGDAKAMRKESDVPLENGNEARRAENPDIVEPAAMPPDGRKLRKLRSLFQPSRSNSRVNISAPSPAGTREQIAYGLPSGSVTRRESVDQRVESPPGSSQSSETQHAVARVGDSPSHSLPSTQKLSRRKSLAKIFSLGRSASSTASLLTTQPALDRGSNSMESDARFATLHAPESLTSQSLQSIKPSLRHSATAPSISSSGQPRDMRTAPGEALSDLVSKPPQRKRKSIFRGGPFSFFDAHRQPSNKSPANETRKRGATSSSHISAKSIPESTATTDSSSSHPTSTDELEGEDTLQLFAPREVYSSRTPAEYGGSMNHSATLELDPGGKRDVIGRFFDAHESAYVNAESDDDVPSL